MVLNEKIPIRNRSIEGLLSFVSAWNIPETEKKEVRKFFDALKLGKITGNQITDGTLSPYITNLKISLEFFKKLSTQLTEKDTDKLCEYLLKDKLQRQIKRKEGKKTIKKEIPFVETGKIKIKNILILYLDWRLKGKADKIAKILKVKPKLKEATIDYLKEDAMQQLYKACKSAEERFLIAVLFDSGARAEEFHNIRKEDMELPKGDGYVKLTLKEEYSKTKGRTISLYWNKSFEAVSDYLKQRISEGVDAKDPIFSKNYKASRKFLERLGKKVLNRSIHYHLFRHSSATYYADKLNRQQLCIRYGWRFRSPMPDRYISRTGMQDKELDEKFQAGEVNVIKEELEREKQKNKIKQEDFEETFEKQNKKIEMLMKHYENFQDILNDIAETDSNNPTKNIIKIEKQTPAESKTIKETLVKK